MSQQSRYQGNSALDGLALGQRSDYIATYTPDLLQPVPRQLNRDDLQLPQPLPFSGVDIWTLYELSWLNLKGKPQVAIGEVRVAADSLNLIESKSFKLYLNSFNQSAFADRQSVARLMTQDLSACAQGTVTVHLHSLDEADHGLSRLAGESLDEQDLLIEEYAFKPDWLVGAAGDEVVEETLYSHLLKSNCLVTQQPDWGSVQIHYRGPRLDRERLLRYLISFRQHNEFHEQCVERIFMDLKRHCHCQQLSVYARYTRRGGLDINPFRSDWEAPPANLRLLRQ